MAAFEYRQAEELREAFVRHSVDYLFVGKAGAIILGFPDTTQDVDGFSAYDRKTGEAPGPKISAPYNVDPLQGAEKCSDRETGEPVSADRLMTVRRCLWRFHQHREAKFEIGNFFDRGGTQRKHIQAVIIEHIGKVVSRWETVFETGEDLETQLVYGKCDEQSQAELQWVIDQSRCVPFMDLSRSSGVSTKTIKRIQQGVRPSKKMVEKLVKGQDRLRTLNTHEEFERQQKVDLLRSACRERRLRPVARFLEVDHSNLSAVLARKRPP